MHAQLAPRVECIYAFVPTQLFSLCLSLRVEDSSGGALVHAGVIEHMSDTNFRRNGAGKEGPAILSLGLLNSIADVTFDGNAFYCAVGKFSGETPAVSIYLLVENGQWDYYLPSVSPPEKIWLRLRCERHAENP